MMRDGNRNVTADDAIGESASHHEEVDVGQALARADARRPDSAMR